MPQPLIDFTARETPRLLLAGFGAYAQAPDNPAARVVERLSAQGWSPSGAALRGRTLPVSWTEAPRDAIEAAQAFGADAVLLLAASTNSQEFRVEMRAQNRAGRRRPDADGKLWRDERILPTGPGVVRTTAPVAEMVQAIKAAGYGVRASSEAGDYVGNFTLYRLLAEFGADPEARPVGCLCMPAHVDLAVAEHAVKAAVEAFAASLGVRHAQRLPA
jgi:pyrrolidone-carboxylate peptidase